MAFWKRILTSLGAAPVHVSPHSNVPMAEGLLIRSPEERNAFMKWDCSPSKRHMLEYIRDNYQVWKKAPCEQCDCIDFHKGTAFKGFVVHLADLDWGSGEVRHLMDYIRQQTLAQGYRSNLSDFREFQKKRWLERIERHSLKPEFIHDETGRTIQRYGNVIIETSFRDGAPLQLRLSACYYQDRQFTEPMEFAGLMRAITV